MRILFLSTVYPTPWEPNKGPANRSTVDSLRALGCEVMVVAPVPWVKRIFHRRQPALPGKYPTYWYPQGIFRRFYHRALWISVRRTLEQVTRDFHPDAVLAFWTHPDGTVALQYAKTLNIPVGIIVGGSDVMLLPNRPTRGLPITNTLRRVDHVFAVGSELVRRVIDLGVDPKLVSDFYCGVDLKAFLPGDRDTARRKLGITHPGPIILWIGNIVDVKAPHRVLEAAKLLLPTIPDLQVVMIGAGPNSERLMSLARNDPDLRPRVIFPGPVHHDELPLWYQAANLFVLPSRSEGVPNVLLEAMAMGLPFVASDVGSIHDLLPYGPSKVVPEGDVGALAHAVGEILTHPHAAPLAPRRYDRLDGAKHLLEHLTPARR